MVAIVKKHLKIEKTLNEMLQIVSVSIFEQTHLQQLLANSPGVEQQNSKTDVLYNQLLFND